MISFQKHSGIHTLTTEQILPIDVKTAWDFFSTPSNLCKITPSHMGFEITSSVEKSVYSGQIITYKVGIVPLIKSNWVTEITQVKDESFFIDEQRFGPYKMWHHEHFFEPLPNGKTLIKDKISYKIPLGFLGRFAHFLCIKRQLKNIFMFRAHTLEQLFNAQKK